MHVTWEERDISPGILVWNYTMTYRVVEILKDDWSTPFYVFTNMENFRIDISHLMTAKEMVDFLNNGGYKPFKF